MAYPKARVYDGVPNWVVAPFVAGGRVYGYMQLASPWNSREVSPEVIDFVSLLAGLGAQAIANDESLEERARERTRFLRQFALMVAHDLGYPLSMFTALLNQLEKRLGPVRDNSLPFLTNLRDEVESMQFLLKEFASLPRPVRKRRLDVAYWLKAMVDELARANPERIVTFDGPGSLFAGIDRRQLRRALQAIFLNSVRYTSEGGFISTTLHSGPTNLRIVVRDNGPGIQAAHRELIFREYFTTDKDRQGLGLTSAKKIIDAHGGMIVAYGSSGAEFQIQLPLE